MFSGYVERILLYPCRAYREDGNEQEAAGICPEQGAGHVHVQTADDRRHLGHRCEMSDSDVFRDVQ